MTKNIKEEFEKVFELIPEIKDFHSTNSSFYKYFDLIIKEYFKNNNKTIDATPFNGIKWPNIALGNVKSIDFLVIGEMILYSYYYIHKNDYSTVFDVGANFGSDTMILSHFGYEVYSFEPDTKTFDILQNKIKLNKLKNVHAINKGLSDKKEVVSFRRVIGNETANHIEGQREYHGESELCSIETITFSDIEILPDLMKINIEGHEKTLVPSIPKEVWEHCDVFMELHGKDCAKIVFEYINSLGINIFSQKINWNRVKCIEEMAFDHLEGYIFISSKDKMLW